MQVKAEVLLNKLGSTIRLEAIGEVSGDEEVTVTLHKVLMVLGDEQVDVTKTINLESRMHCIDQLFLSYTKCYVAAQQMLQQRRIHAVV